ncbi:MAG TPA: PAS domain S-box protein [Gammaproteobacteria bacterium]|nr:PAS domain S-box protein [Gammaproteobacteria bacterium]
MTKTEKKRPGTLQQRLRALEGELDGIFAATVDGLIIADAHGIIRRFNPSAEKMFGYRADEVVGTKLNQLMTDRDRHQHDGYMQNYLKTGTAHIIGIGREVYGRRRDGTEFPLYLAVGELPEAGNERRFIGILRDISKEKAMESALRVSEQELRLMIESAPIGVVTLGADAGVHYVNAALLRMLGIMADDIKGGLFESWIIPEDREHFRQFCQKILMHRTVAEIDLHLRPPGGELLHVSLHGGLVDAPLRGPMITAHVINRTPQVLAEQEAGAHREALAQVDRLNTLGEMASGIAHEINQPLTAITAYAQAINRMMEQVPALPGEMREALEQMSTQAERAGEIIQRMRGYVRKRAIAYESTDLNECLRSIVKLAKSNVRENECHIHLELNSELPRVTVDGVQIQQVVMNLILNALDAMKVVEPEKRKIVVRTNRPAPDRVQVDVADRGPGLSSTVANVLFTPFVTTKAGGMGLGLPISLSIITAHGGKFWHASNPGGGMCFSFTLPVAMEAVDEAL